MFPSKHTLKPRKHQLRPPSVPGRERHPTAGDWSSNERWSAALLRCKGTKAPMTAIGSTGQPGQDVTPANHDGSRDCSRDSVAVAHCVDGASRQRGRVRSASSRQEPPQQRLRQLVLDAHLLSRHCSRLKVPMTKARILKSHVRGKRAPWYALIE